MPASPTGTVPRAWPTVLRLAFAARPGLALLGLAAVLRGKRVRGWNRLCLAASSHADCYGAWIETVEPTLLRHATLVRPSLIGAVLLADPERPDDIATTRASLVQSFGSDMPIFDASGPLPVSDRPAWLLPIVAGDRVAPGLAAALADRLPGCAARIAYWDEDRLVAGRRADPWIKPDWDPLLFGAQGGLVGSCVIRSDAVSDGIVDHWHAHILAVGADDPAPLHLPLILTHRSQRRAVPGLPATPAPPRMISVIVPTRDQADLLETCLAGLARTRFPGDHEIIIVDNDSREHRTKIVFQKAEAAGQARILACPDPFNFSALVNAGVAAARGDLLCLLNNDIEIASFDWAEHMTNLAVRDDVGAVGARLLYPDGAIQHAGVALGIGDAAGHVDKGAEPVPGQFAPWHNATRTVSAVTAACLMVDRAKFLAVGGANAEDFAIDFNDVDLCLRLAARGWRTVYCAEATLIHHESRSRGTIRTGRDLARFERELTALRTRWGTATIVDPYHSPLFRRQSERCLLAF